MTFLTHWQPLRNEDAHTALVFGFLRHTDPAQGLSPWLTSVLSRDRSVAVPALTHDDFWPPHGSIYEGGARTVPDLAFAADDGAPLLVVVEAKPWFNQHDFAQVSREVIDAAAHTGHQRIALIMVGAGLHAQPDSADWEQRLREALLLRGMDGIELELRYSSWKRLGQAIETCAEQSPTLRRYADDVRDKLRAQGLLGYEGAPMLEDLEELTVTNAVKVFNRTMIAARWLVLAVTGDPQFLVAGFTAPAGAGKSFHLARDTFSTAITANEAYFTTTLLLTGCRKPTWPSGAGAFIAFDLDREDQPYIQVGAFFYTGTGPVDLVDVYSNSGEGEPKQPALAGRDHDVLDLAFVNGAGAEWVCAERPWQLTDDHGDEDVRWVLARLDDAARIWDATAASPDSWSSR
jgi:hypothetical protein